MYVKKVLMTSLATQQICHFLTRRKEGEKEEKRPAASGRCMRVLTHFESELEKTQNINVVAL